MSDEITVDEAGRASYPSLAGQGLEEVDIPSPPPFKPHVGLSYYDSMPPGPQRVAIRDVIPTFTKMINFSFSEGDYGILDHFAKAVDGAEYFDQALMPQVKALAAESKKISTDEEGKALLEKTNKFLAGLRMAKPPAK